jgi:hypothetical protein
MRYIPGRFFVNHNRIRSYTMGDEVYGTRPGGEQEGGTSNASGQEVSVPQGSQPAGQELEGSELRITPEYLKEMEQRIIEEATRRAQSMTDKMGSRLDKEIQSALERATETIELGKQAGIKYTPEQEQAIRDKAINTAYTKLNQQDPSSTQNSAQPQDQGSQPNDPGVWVSQEVQRIMGETGVYIQPEEANKLILGENGENKLTPYQYIQAFESLARQRQLNQNQPQGRSPAIPSYVTGGQASTSQSALRQAYDKEIAQINRGTHPTIKRGETLAIQNLEIAYKQRGLEL